MDERSAEEVEQWNLAQIKQRQSRLHAKPIGAVMRRLMTQTGYGQIESSNLLNEKWSEAVGSVLAKLTRPGNIRRGVLQVTASNSATTQELYFQRKQVIARLQQIYPEGKVTNIKTRVGPID